jgi:large subunit ribosomal protein L4e
MKAKIYEKNGTSKKDIEIPAVFSSPIREDLVLKILEAKKVKQPFSPSPVAGKQASASGKIIHRRHVWKSQYGRGMSRIPRKALTNKGSQFNWVGATVPNAVGGRRAHPPKIESMINTNKINKKELKIALASSIASTVNQELVAKRYSRLEKKDLPALPLVIDSKITKVAELISVLKKVLGASFEVALRNKKIRSGKGKMRGRKYKSSAGILFVKGKEDKLSTKRFEVVSVENLSVNSLSKSGLGRLTVYTENAIKELGEETK